ncbi:MAG: EpsG family protein [Saprospiraceae bacterium]
MRTKTSITGYITFLVWPFFSLIFAMQNYRSSFAKNIMWFFCSYFGYTFVISDEEMDANRYRSNFEEFYEWYDMGWNDMLNLLFIFEGQYTDLYRPLITFLVSRFTGNFQVFFAIIGLVMGYFFSRNIWYLIKQVDKNKPLSIVAILFLFTFALIVPFWNINGFRFYTAAHVFLFGTLPFLVEGKKQFLIVACFSPLLHFTFVFPVALLLAFGIMGNRINIYFVIFISSIFFVKVDPGLINDNYKLAPEFIQTKVRIMTSKDYIKARSKGLNDLNWYVKGSQMAINSIVYFFLIFCFFFRRKVLKESNLKKLFCFSLFLLGVANFATNVPSGSRFVIVANLFAFSLIFLFATLESERSWIGKRLPVFIIPTLIYCIVQMRIGFDFIGLRTIFSNTFISSIIENDIALIYLFK